MKQLQITNLLMNYNFINSTKKPAFIRILLSSVILLLTFSLAEAQQVSVKQVKKHKSASKKIRENRMKKYDFDKKETEKEDDEYDGPDRAMEMEYKKTIDPATGIVPRERLMNALDKTKKSKDLQRSGQFATLGNFTWTERGPNTDAVGVSNGNTRPNSGVTSGRMRAINVDLADASGKTVWVAGVSGGLWKTTDITAASPNWILINDYLSNLAVTSITQDPSNTNKDIMYFCTGEAFFNSDAVRGNGVFKSTDHGLTWNLLASSQNANFYYCSKILCDAAGNVYVSTRNGVFRSIDGGTNWVNIAPTGLSARFSDMELSATGRLHVSSGIFSTCAYRFTDNPATVTTSGWTSPTSGYPSSSVRIELACSGNTLFAIPSNASYQVTAVYKSTDGGATWTANNFTAGNTTDFGSQAWFCLAIDIDPSNINNIIIGNLTCLKSTDGGSTWSKISEWVGTTGQYVHADQHIIKWYDNGNKLLIGCDGGIHYSSDKGVTIRDRNVGLRLKQFFSCATIPTANSNYFLAGAQDNGVHKLTTAGLGGSTEVTGGDGGFVAIDQDETNYQFGSYVNNVYRRSSNSGTNWSSFYFYKGTSSTATNFGTFINPYDYDNTANIIYAGADAGEIFRWTTAQTTAAGTYYATTGFPTGATILTGITSFNSAKISAVAVSPFTSNRVYLGTDGGRVVYIDNANTITSSTAGTNISAAGFPAGTVSCINFGTTEQNLITCFSNYGVSNIWVSSNGGTSWTAIDGNLPDMPIRWCMFYPGDNSRAIIATETGVWNTDLINGVSTSWYAEPSFPSVKTNMLKYRSSDGMLIAATHGRGLFTTVLCILVTPTVNIAANPGTTICSGTPVTVTATANNTGGGTINYNFKIGAGSVQSSASNIYTSTTLANGNAVTCDITVTGGTCLTATTATSNGLTMVVNPNLTPTVSIAANPGTTICSGTSVTITATANNTGGGTINYNFKIGAGSVQSSASNTYTTSSLANGNVVTCDITVTGGTCLTATTATSNGLTMVVNPNLTPTVSIAANPGTTICSGTSVTITATANNTGGGTINYNFKIGAGSVQSSASNTYTSTTLANGNVVTCDITVTGGTCLTATTATSNSLTMVVNPNLTPTVSIAANPGTTICSGISVTITATANNTGGGTINYNFKIGAGSVQSSASNTYTTSSLANGNVVTCDITVTGGTCLTATTATSNGLTIILGVNSFTGNGNWTDIARWTCGSVPLPTDAIEIAAGANAILNIDLSLLGSLLMNATSTLTVDPTNTFDVAVGGTANFNGQSVTFRSTNTGTASLGKILGALTGATNVTVERYIPNNGFRSWRLLSVPTAGSQTFNQAWQEGNSSLQNSKPGFGTQITGIGSLSSAQAAGFDNTSPYPALLSYNVLSNIWEGMPSTNTALSTKNGYFLYVRGDRTQGISGLISNSSATTLRTTGTVYQGNLNSEIIPANSFGLIGNLYPSAIDFTKLNRSAGINNQFYIWDSKKGSATSSSLGIYQSFSNTNGFQTLIGGGSFVLGLPNISIQSGQAYFVQAGASSGTVTLNENAKISSNGTLGFRPTVPLNQLVKLDSKLYTNTGTSSEINDANVVVFDNGYANAVDADDALKLANSGENFGIAKGDKTLVIEGRLTINSKDTIFFKLWNLQQKSYSFEFVPQNLGTTGLIAMLQDSYLNSNTPLDLNSTNTINFTVDANTASADSNRFKIVFTASNPLPLSFISIAANRNGTDVLVDWKVAAENRINYYEVERSTDGRNFVTAGTVSSTGNNNPTSQYRFTDANIALKTWFYRIKSVGITGEIRYSSIVKLVAGNVKPGFSLSPNPVEGGIINLQFKNQPEGKYSVRILNNLGQQLQNTIISHAGRNSNQLLQLPGTIASGTYQIEIIAPDLTNTIKTLLVNRK